MNSTHLIPAILLVIACSISMSAQDTLIFENEWVYPVEIVEESESQVQYRKYGVENSPLYIMKKRFVTETQYQDPESAKLKFKPDRPWIERELDVWLEEKGSGRENKGLLHQLSDSMIVLRKKSVLLSGGKKYASEEVQPFFYHQIEQLKVRKQNHIRRSALIGAGAGFTVGMLMGMIIFKDSPPCDNSVIGGEPCHSSLSNPRSRYEKSLLLGFGSAAGGFLAGGIRGAIRINIPIRGKKDMFNAAIPKLERIGRVLDEG